MSARHACSLPFGAELLDDGQRTRFRLWAPALSRVQLEVEGLPPIAMRAGGGGPDAGLFEAEAACGAGARYRYRINPELAVPDPASRAQLEDVHGYSLVIDPRAYEWQNRDWRGRPWEETVIYELHTGCCGGFDGVRKRLPELAELGVSAVELMPIADFPGTRNWGYDGVLLYAPDRAYGTPQQLKAMIDEAHGLGLCVYLDVVYNHFGPDGNYLHAYAPPFFDPNRHSPWGAAIDHARPQVREFFIANALYWLHEYRFDGLRFDAVHAIDDKNFLVELGARVRASLEPGRQVHLMLENEHNEAAPLERAYDAQWNDDAHNAVHVLLTGERESYYANYAEAPAAKLARCLAEGFAYQGEPSPSHGDRPRGTPSSHLPPCSFIFFLQNHDQIGNRAFGERLATLADAQALDAAVLLQLLSPQIPLLFMGEDWGARTPFLYFTDFHDQLAEAVREGRRKEFAAFAAFSEAAARSRIPDPNAEDTYRRSMPDFAEARDGAHRTRREWYRRLLVLRRKEIIPRLRGARSLGADALGSAAVAAAWRMSDGTVLRIAANFGEQDEGATAPAPTAVLLCDSRDPAGAAWRAGRLLAHSASALVEPREEWA
jgi:malto-oligosyltrehalose trehalohydrolase